ESFATVNYAVQGDDVYIDAETITNAITAVVEANSGDQGALENLGYDSTQVSTEVSDTIDTVTVKLSVDRTDVYEGEGDLVYTATIYDATGAAVTTQTGVTVHTALGDITIAAGSSSGVLNVPVQGDDVYLDSEVVENAITGVTETDAGAADAFENLTFDGTQIDVTVHDTINTV